MKSTTMMLALVLSAGWFFAGCEKNFGDERPEGRLVPKTVDEDPNLPAITVNGAMLHAEAFGHPDSALLVVIHGGPGADYRSLLNCKAFADHGFRVIFYDQSGTGLSERFPKSHYKSVDLLTDELAGVIEHYRTSPEQKVFLLGHSWGAMLATAFINLHPTTVDGAILGEPGGFIWRDVKDYVARSRDFNLLSEGFNDAVFTDQFLTGQEDEHEVLDYKFKVFTAVGDSKDSPIGNEGRPLRFRSGAVTVQAYFEIGDKTKPDWTTNLSQFTTKILFIYSENNTAYGLEHAKKVAAPYPNVQFFETLDAGHDMLSFPTGWGNSFPTMLSYLNSLK